MHRQRARRIAGAAELFVELREHRRGVVIESRLDAMIEFAEERLETLGRAPHLARRPDARIPLGGAVVQRLAAVASRLGAARVGEVLIDRVKGPGPFHAIRDADDLTAAQAPEDRRQVEARYERLQQ